VPLRQQLKESPLCYSNNEAQLLTHQEVPTHWRELFLALEQALVQDAATKQKMQQSGFPHAVRRRSHLLGGKLNENKQQDNKLKRIGVGSPTPMSTFLDI
jgi:hypothetical protein